MRHHCWERNALISYLSTSLIYQVELAYKILWASFCYGIRVEKLIGTGFSAVNGDAGIKAQEKQGAAA